MLCTQCRSPTVEKLMRAAFSPCTNIVQEDETLTPLSMVCQTAVNAVQPIPNLQETTAYYVTTTSPAHSTRQETCRRSTWLSVGYRYKVRAGQEKNKNRKGVIKQLYMAKLEVHRTPMAEQLLWVSGQNVLDKQNLRCIFPAAYELQSMDAIACLSSCMSGHVMVIRSKISFMTALP